MFFLSDWERNREGVTRLVGVSIAVAVCVWVIYSPFAVFFIGLHLGSAAANFGWTNLITNLMNPGYVVDDETETNVSTVLRALFFVADMVASSKRTKMTQANSHSEHKRSKHKKTKHKGSTSSSSDSSDTQITPRK